MNTETKTELAVLIEIDDKRCLGDPRFEVTARIVEACGTGCDRTEKHLSSYGEHGMLRGVRVAQCWHRTEIIGGLTTGYISAYYDGLYRPRAEELAEAAKPLKTLQRSADKYDAVFGRPTTLAQWIGILCGAFVAESVCWYRPIHSQMDDGIHQTHDPRLLQWRAPGDAASAWHHRLNAWSESNNVKIAQAA